VKKPLIVLLWTVGIWFGTGMLIGFVCGILFFAQALFGHPVDSLAKAMSWLAMIVPCIAAIVVLVLGLRGRLPGTGRRTQREIAPGGR
jgi:hypothetical protein